MALLPKGGRVLDLGCGPGRASYQLRQAGFKPDAVDASPEMVRLANENFELDARLATFDEMDAGQKYEGVWANFSLLHAPQASFPGHLKQVHCVLNAEGIFHIGMKRGNGERRDRLGRFYSFYETDVLSDHMRRAGFDVLKVTEGEEKGLAGSLDPFVLLLAKKA